MLKTASDLRQLNLDSLTRRNPELQKLTIQQLRELADDTDRMAEDCGPFDSAYENLLQLSHLYHRLAFLKDANERNISSRHEREVARFVSKLGSNILDLTAEECLNLAVHHEEAAKQAGLSALKAGKLTRRVEAYIELAAVLERFEALQKVAA